MVMYDFIAYKNNKRIIKKDIVNNKIDCTAGSIALDYDLIRIARDSNVCIYERKNTKPDVKVGDELLVKETWQKRNGKYEFMQDLGRGALGHWEYANKMPLEIARYKAVVKDIELVKSDLYEKRRIKNIMYNRRIFGVPWIPQDRWFREGGEVPPAKNDEVYVVKYSLVKIK